MRLSETDLMTMDGILGFRIDRLAKGLKGLIYCRFIKDTLTPECYEYEYPDPDELAEERAEMMTEDGGWNDYEPSDVNSDYLGEYLIDCQEILYDDSAWFENGEYLNEEDVQRMCKEFNVNYEDFSAHRHKLAKLERARKEERDKRLKNELNNDNDLFD